MEQSNSACSSFHFILCSDDDAADYYFQMANRVCVNAPGSVCVVYTKYIIQKTQTSPCPLLRDCSSTRSKQWKYLGRAHKNYTAFALNQLVPGRRRSAMLLLMSSCAVPCGISARKRYNDNIRCCRCSPYRLNENEMNKQNARHTQRERERFTDPTSRNEENRALVLCNVYAQWTRYECNFEAAWSWASRLGRPTTTRSHAEWCPDTKW